MEIDKLAHALGEVASRPMFGDLDFAPGAVRVEEDEQIHRAVGDCQEFRAQRGGSTDYAMARVKRSPKRTAN
jgi:hypothetical protein